MAQFPLAIPPLPSSQPMPHSTKAEVTKIAQMAHDGIAHVMQPVHTLFGEDTVFALASGPQYKAQRDTGTAAQQGAAAANTLSRAIVKAISHARDLHGIPAAKRISRFSGERL